MLTAPRTANDDRLWHLPSGTLEVALVSAKPVPALDLQLMADLLARGQACTKDGTASNRLRLARPDLAAGRHLPVPDLLVLADDFDELTEFDCHIELESLVERAQHVFLLGAAAHWWVRTRWAHGLRAAVHWSKRLDAKALACGVVASGSIFEVQGRWTSCCGGAATLDLGLSFLREALGATAAQRVQDDLCIGSVRRPEEPQRHQPVDPGSDLSPKLVEALALMKANIEEPLMTEDIANLVGMSRRQLERVFKRQFDTVPSRYYMELRLQRARELLTEARYSLLEIGLMCGFSSGSHFSTSYSAVFGTTPREERHRALRVSVDS